MKKIIIVTPCLIAILIMSAYNKDSGVINDNTTISTSPTYITSQTPTFSPVPTQADTSDNITPLNEDTAVAMVRNRMKDLNDPRYYGDDTFVRVDHLDNNNNYVIQVYNSGEDMSNTINWYTVDRISGYLTAMFDE